MRIFLFVLLALVFLAHPVPAAENQTLVHTVISVATSSTAVSTRASRSILILQNDSDTTIFCKAGGAAAAVDEGIMLVASGGTAFFDAVTPTGAVACIQDDSGTKKLLVTEG